MIFLLLGYRTVPTYSALLNGWYTLVRDKRSTRQDFLKAIVKALDIEVSPASMSQVRIIVSDLVLLPTISSYRSPPWTSLVIWSKIWLRSSTKRKRRC